MKIILSILISFVLIVVITLTTITTQVFRFWVQDPHKDDDPVLFTIEQGTAFVTVAQELEERELVASDFWLRVYARLNGTAGEVRAGSYQIPPGMSYAKLMDVFTQDTACQDIWLTIPEGYLLRQMEEVVTTRFTITPEEWRYWTGVHSPLENHPFVVTAGKPDSVDLEGYLFPDTYRFFQNATAEDIVTRLLDEMQTNVESIEGYEHLSGVRGVSTLHEMLTLASIIEKEVPSTAEMRVVSDIFQKRLDINMALQACSTLNYVTGKNIPAVTREDLAIDSPYNTYMYPGLPPGPIANPGLSAMLSVYDPSPNPYYFFLSTPQGETIYSQTYEEHLQQKARYLD